MKDRTAAATDTLKAYHGSFRRDPLRGVRILRRWLRLIVYPLVGLLAPLDHFIFEASWLESAITHLGGGYPIAIFGVEFGILYGFKLRKQSAYPTMLAMELGGAHGFDQACQDSVRLTAELLGAEKVILAWSAHPGDQLTTMATHGIPLEDMPLATPLPWCEQPVKQAIEERKVVITSASEARAWLSSSDGHGRVVYVPLLSLDRFVGLLVMVAGRKASDLKNKSLLTMIGLAMGLTLDNLHHAVELRQIAIRDELTRLFTRRYFFERLDKEFKAARRSGRPLGLLILDVDNLKLINDTYGHDVGDAVLANLGKLLAHRVRGEDIAARLGGDEFALLLRDTDERGALAAAARLEKALRTRPMYKRDGVEITLAASCGVAGYPWAGNNASEIMRCADAHMYEVKATRKGRPQAATMSGQRKHSRAAKASR